MKRSPVCVRARCTINEGDPYVAVSWTCTSNPACGPGWCGPRHRSERRKVRARRRASARATRGNLPTPPPRVSMGGGTQPERLRYVGRAGGAPGALAAPPPPHPPTGRAPGDGGAAGCRLQVPQAPAGSPGGRNKGGGGCPPPPPSTSPPLLLPRAGGHFWEHPPPADGGSCGGPGPRGGHRPPPGGGGLLFRRGGGRRSRLAPTPQGTAPGGPWRRRPPLGRGRTPPV